MDELLCTAVLDDEPLEEELPAIDELLPNTTEELLPCVMLELLAAFDEPFDEDDGFAIGISSTPQSLFISLIGLSNSKSFALQVPTELDNWDRTSLLVASHSFAISSRVFAAISSPSLMQSFFEASPPLGGGVILSASEQERVSVMARAKAAVSVVLVRWVFIVFLLG
jgi:hypothetical protein